MSQEPRTDEDKLLAGMMRRLLGLDEHNDVSRVGDSSTMLVEGDIALSDDEWAVVNRLRRATQQTP